MTTPVSMSPQGQELVPMPSLERHTVEELVADPDSVRVALEWGFETNDPTVKKLHNNVVVTPEEAGTLIIFHPPNKPPRASQILIRQSPYDATLATSLKTVLDVHMAANTNVYSREHHGEQLKHAKRGQRSEQGWAAYWNAAPTLGGAALGAGAGQITGATVAGVPITSALTEIMAFQTDLRYIITGAGLVVAGGVVKSVRDAVKLHKTHQKQLEEMSPPVMPANAEELFKRLTPTFEKLANMTGVDEVYPNEVRVINQDYTMRFDHVEEMLKKDGGPKYSDYEAVLHDLKSRAKAAAAAASTSNFTPMWHEPTSNKYTFNPAKLVGEMLVASKGEVWSEAFMGRVMELGDAQFALKNAERELKAFQDDTDRVAGTGGKKHEESLEEDVKRLRDTIDLRVLQVYKLNAEYMSGEAVEHAPKVIDPYKAEDMLEAGQEPKEPSKRDAPAISYVPGQNWPSLSQKKPDER